MKIISPVQLFLYLLMIVTLFSLPILGVAPNRILTPESVYIYSLLENQGFIVLVFLMVITVLPMLIWPSQLAAWSIGVICCINFSYLSWLIGQFAISDAINNEYARYSFGSGFWAISTLLWLLAMDAGRGIFTSIGQRVFLAAMFLMPVCLMVSSNHFDAMSLLKEYYANSEAFDSAFFEHTKIVGITLILTVFIGLLLGIQCYKKPIFGKVCLNLLSILQTIPSIALFGLLLAPLSALAKNYPWLSDFGISGIGTAPAVIALLLYSLLPMVRSTNAGLWQVQPSILESSLAMGMSPIQSLLKIHLPLALPVILSGLRVTTVQAIGLTMVAALIGAGGFGTIMFRGLSASAIDLVLLGVIPVVLMAVFVDAFLKILVQWTQPLEDEGDSLLEVEGSKQ